MQNLRPYRTSVSWLRLLAVGLEAVDGDRHAIRLPTRRVVTVVQCEAQARVDRGIPGVQDCDFDGLRAAAARPLLPGRHPGVVAIHSADLELLAGGDRDLAADHTRRLRTDDDRQRCD